MTKKLTNIEYPKGFKTTENANAAVLTGHNHEEYFHAIEMQQAIQESKYTIR